MADKNIKKVILPPSKLLSANVEEGSLIAKYLVRYRVISEDKTRTSAWSPKYAVEARTVQNIINSATVPYTIFSNGDRLTLSWTTPDALKSPTFDIYVSWSENNSTWTEYSFAGTAAAESFTVAVKSGQKYVKFWNQITTFPKNKSNAAKLFETDSTSTAYRINGGTP
jgi:hypothetical protein